MSGGKSPKRKGLEDMEWRTLACLPDYAISEYGDLKRIRKGATRHIGYMPKGHLKSGYNRFTLLIDGEKKYLWAHRLVCEAFHGPAPSPKHQVAHWDGDRLNNHFSNLRWATAKENCVDRNRHGRTARGFASGRTKLTDQTVLRMRSEFTDGSNRVVDIANKYGIAWTTASYILSRRSWKHV